MADITQINSIDFAKSQWAGTTPANPEPPLSISLSMYRTLQALWRRAYELPPRFTPADIDAIRGVAVAARERELVYLSKYSLLKRTSYAVVALAFVNFTFSNNSIKDLTLSVALLGESAAIYYVSRQAWKQHQQALYVHRQALELLATNI